MRPGLALAIVAALVYLALVARQLNRPLMYDDANFALAARAIADTGLPFGNQGWMSERGDFSQREQWALWHPPLYIYGLGLLARVGGWTPAVLRLFGVAGGLATGALTFRLASDLTRGSHALKDLAGGLAVAVLLLCPLVIQSTLVLDIDFALLLPLTLLFVVLYLRWHAASRRWLWLAPLFAVLLWSKMTNPLPLIGVAAVWQALRGRFVRAALDLVVIGVGGVALFAVSWLLLGRWLGFPLDMPFGVNLVQWQDSSDVARRAYQSAGAFIEGLQPTALWLGPGLVAIGLIGIAMRGPQLVCRWRVVGADLLVGAAAVLVLGYVNKSAGWFPKYQVALAPMLACLAAPLVAYAVSLRPRPACAITVVSAVGVALVTLWQVRDAWALERTWSIGPPSGAWLLAILVIATIGGLASKSPAIALMGLVGLAVGWSAAIDFVQLRAPYQTDYWYGTTGTVEAANWVDTHLVPGDTYVAAKEVAIRARDQRYIDQDSIVYLASIGRGFDGTWMGEPVRALVVWEREAYVADVLTRALAPTNFVQAERFGDYVVYVPGS